MSKCIAVVFFISLFDFLFFDYYYISMAHRPVKQTADRVRFSASGFYSLFLFCLVCAAVLETWLCVFIENFKELQRYL